MTKQGKSMGGERVIRRRHSPEFKAHVVAECSKPGMSTAAVALHNGLNANMLRRWVTLSEAGLTGTCEAQSEPDRTAALALAGQPSFVAVSLPAQHDASPPVEVELKQGSLQVRVLWPAAAAGDLGSWLRELLR